MKSASERRTAKPSASNVGDSGMRHALKAVFDQGDGDAQHSQRLVRRLERMAESQFSAGLVAEIGLQADDAVGTGPTAERMEHVAETASS